ncbi:MAG: MFS transporter, partial [Ardenticatenales bacterium]|nr:MFS transporter [Ardenticatenales bacterium]
FSFMLLHQVDKLLIGPLTTPIMDTFGINEAQMGAVFTGALIVGAFMYPIWGILYDRFARAKLLALASLLWGLTTWLSAIVPNYPSFLATRASTGIDDASYPGLYSLISDYFGPKMRGRIYGLLQTAMPLGYLLGMFLGLFLGEAVGWRGVFIITGSLGLVLSVLIYRVVREPPRGKSEPELADLEQLGTYRFEWATAKGLFRKRTLRLLFIQGFFGVFPWNVITYWFFSYLETERDYASEEIMATMVVAVLAMTCGYLTGGTIGDFLFRHTPRGRLIVSTVAVLLGALLMVVTLNLPLADRGLFMITLAAAAFFMPIPAPNMISTIYDVTLPEVRSTASAIQYFIESAGAALAPLIAGLIAVNYSLQTAILVISTSTWLICAAFFALTAFVIPDDIATLRRQLRERAAQEV